jgi:hypothetical protein
MESDNFTTWRKATYSNANGSCVEVAATLRRDGIGVRDTAQHGSGPVLRFPMTAWQTFIQAAKYGPASHFS